jgi:mRNA interferase RelE/StbE
MAWTVEFDPQAEKELDRLDSQQAKRILKYLFERIATDEDPRFLLSFGNQQNQIISGH